MKRRDASLTPAVHGSGGGQILALFALFLIVLVGFAAVATDLGSWLKVRRDYQNAADAAALAGVSFLVGTSPDRASARLAAWRSLESQLGVTTPCTNPLTPCGDTPATSPVVVGPYSLWVSTPPIGAGAKYPGASTGSADRTVFTWIEAQNPSFLARVFGINGSQISAWATAGLFANKWAVITLRQPGQAGPAQPSINLAGTTVKLTVVNGDVGGNYDMKLNSSTNLVLPGDAQVYLHDYVSCGQSCWGNTQINDGNGNLKVARQLPGPVPDPFYPAPTSVASGPTGPTLALPYGYGPANAADTKSGNGNVNLGSGGDNPDSAHLPSVTTPGGVQTCDTAKAVRIGPGYYTNISVNGSICLVLDPTYRHTCLSLGTGSGFCSDVPTAVPQTQLPGVFYINGTMSVKGGGMIVGDGVTLVFRPLPSPNDNGQFTAGGGASSPGIVALNSTETSGAWTRRGVSPYTWATTGCSFGQSACWQYTSAYQSDPTQLGMAVYVMRRDQLGGSVPADDNTSVVKINASAALTWTGITYAPHDNVSLAGQPGHQGVGQLVAWTFTFNGQTDVMQTYGGPDNGLPLLIEPKLGQP